MVQSTGRVVLKQPSLNVVAAGIAATVRDCAGGAAEAVLAVPRVAAMARAAAGTRMARGLIVCDSFVGVFVLECAALQLGRTEDDHGGLFPTESWRQALRGDPCRLTCTIPSRILGPCVERWPTALGIRWANAGRATWFAWPQPIGRQADRVWTGRHEPRPGARVAARSVHCG